MNLTPILKVYKSPRFLTVSLKTFGFHQDLFSAFGIVYQTLNGAQWLQETGARWWDGMEDK